MAITSILEHCLLASHAATTAPETWVADPLSCESHLFQDITQHPAASSWLVLPWTSVSSCSALLTVNSSQAFTFYRCSNTVCLAIMICPLSKLPRSLLPLIPLPCRTKSLSQSFTQLQVKLLLIHLLVNPLTQGHWSQCQGVTTAAKQPVQARLP